MMRNKIIIGTMLAIFSAFCLHAENERVQKKPDWINFGFYENANKDLETAGDVPDRVVFLGNSITQFWVERRPDFFASHPNYVGRGIAGQTTYQFLGRFREDVINLHPKVVVINAATNDIGENTHPYVERRTFGNIVSLVELAEANGIKVILTSTLPAVKYRWNPDVKDAPDKVESLNRLLKEYASSKGIPFVDYYSSMITADGSRAMDSRYTYDGIHPTAEGYEVMESMIVPVVEKVLAAK